MKMTFRLVSIQHELLVLAIIHQTLNRNQVRWLRICIGCPEKTLFFCENFILYIITTRENCSLRYSLDVYCIHHVKSRGQTDTFYLAKFRNVYNQKLKAEFKHSVLVDLRLNNFFKIWSKFWHVMFKFLSDGQSFL